MTVGADGTVSIGEAQLRVQRADDGSVRVEGLRGTRAWTAVADRTRWIFVDGGIYTFEVDAGATPRRRSASHHGSLTAPMPATVRKIVVKPGDVVSQGDVLVVLEAMKMELPVRAPAAGTVGAIKCREGEMVQAGHELLEVAP